MRSMALHTKAGGCAGITHMIEEPVTGKERTAQPGGLTVTVTTTGNIRLLTPAGEIDHHTGDSPAWRPRPPHNANEDHLVAREPTAPPGVSCLRHGST